LREILERLAALTGRAAPRVRVPRVVPLAYAALGEFVLGPAGIRTDVPFDGVRMAKERMFYSNAKAVRELGLRFGSVTTALADAVRWYDDHGYTGTPRGMNGARS
jgi:dihydroflavonol-4-reductase